MKQKFTSLEDALGAEGVLEYKENRYSSKAITANQRFVRLTTIQQVFETTSNGKRCDAWVCRCDCGNYKVVRAANLLHGMSKSCGCLVSDLNKARGDNSERARVKRKLRSVWSAMKNRCCNKDCIVYASYGGRGIYICEQWEKAFDFFYVWALLSGYKEGLTLDRIDNDNGYFPENCRWVDSTVQANNRRNGYYAEYQGEKWSATDLANHLGISRSSVFAAKYQKKYGIKVGRRYVDQAV